MSAVEIAVERVKRLPDAKAQMLLCWLDQLEAPSASVKQAPNGAKAALGYARRFHAAKSTADWMDDLRSGER